MLGSIRIKTFGVVAMIAGPSFSKATILLSHSNAPVATSAFIHKAFAYVAMVALLLSSNTCAITTCAKSTLTTNDATFLIIFLIAIAQKTVSRHSVVFGFLR